MNIYQKNQLQKILAKKRKEKEAIKKLDLDPMLKVINEKRKPSIKQSELPF